MSVWITASIAGYRTKTMENMLVNPMDIIQIREGELVLYSYMAVSS